MLADNNVQSVERAVKILEEMAKENDGLGVTELSRRLDLHKSTVYRLLSTLVTVGYAEQNPETEKYRLGVKLLYLGGVILERMDLRNEAHDLLKQLSQDVNETVHLVVPDGDQVLYIDKIDTMKTIRMYSQIGRRATYYASAVGKAILAYSDEKYVEKIISQGLIRRTPNTITDPGELKRCLSQIRSNGYSIDDEENEEGIRCIGAPIFGHAGKVIGAISVSGPIMTVTKEKTQILAEKVKKCAEQISIRMGWREQ
ncbi:MAG: IclR family transcriptional regulator [Thermoanaerobacterales bacterium]|nr:IclR family transcriptional regulator [Thermoanaerobacterales bacterium]